MTDLDFEPINVYDGKSLEDTAGNLTKGLALEKLRARRSGSAGDARSGAWKLEPFLVSVIVHRGGRREEVLENVEMHVTCPELKIDEPYGTELQMAKDLQDTSIVLLVSIDSLAATPQQSGTLTLEVSCGNTKLPIKKLPVEFIETD